MRVNRLRRHARWLIAAMAMAWRAAAGQQPDSGPDDRPGGGGRAAELSFDPGDAGTDECGRGRDPSGADGVPAARGRPGAGEPRHAEHLLRTAAAARRHPGRGWRSGATISARCGTAAWACWSPGSRSISDCARPTSPLPTAARDQAQAAVNRTRYDVSVATADAFLTVVAAQQTAQAARAAVDSWQVLLKSIHALVAAQLRPGADESRVQAELAAAQTQLARPSRPSTSRARRWRSSWASTLSQLSVNPGKLAGATAAGPRRSRRSRRARKSAGARAECGDRTGSNPNSRRSNGRIIRSSSCRAWPPRAAPAW